ncbi:Glutathione gamma-glutamylcysteinyltransferase 1 [Platanthera guangdongensis]|uniref:glutathione gamma-glutamylcysteinyltransferase n=1 Tax=Platanthera guangdongensis TaxID=2320717 RepID=A0ABR2MFE2_9ASPA
MAVGGLYRRILPSPPAIEFASSEGKQLFSEALQCGTMEGFFKLISSFQTQSEPAYCGLASLSMVLNALSIDPGRKWKADTLLVFTGCPMLFLSFFYPNRYFEPYIHKFFCTLLRALFGALDKPCPWRWFDESMLDCCEPLEKVKAEGITFGKVACLAHCSGAKVKAYRTNQSSLDDFRDYIIRCTSSEEWHLIASYHRKPFKQFISSFAEPTELKPKMPIDVQDDWLGMISIFESMSEFLTARGAQYDFKTSQGKMGTNKFGKRNH